MPYHIEDDNSDCSGYAVVKDDDETIMGCHDTLGEAEDQLAALYAVEESKQLPWGEQAGIHRRTHDETVRDIARMLRH